MLLGGSEYAAEHISVLIDQLLGDWDAYYNHLPNYRNVRISNPYVPPRYHHLFLYLPITCLSVLLPNRQLCVNITIYGKFRDELEMTSKYLSSLSALIGTEYTNDPHTLPCAKEDQIMGDCFDTTARYWTNTSFTDELFG